MLRILHIYPSYYCHGEDFLHNSHSSNIFLASQLLPFKSMSYSEHEQCSTMWLLFSAQFYSLITHIAHLIVQLLQIVLSLEHKTTLCNVSLLCFCFFQFLKCLHYLLNLYPHLISCGKFLCIL